ncbi:MAG: response regulator transcription factor [Spirochaetales bacterium]|nr:response regulator transcription factor [Spirochaetales bacterium]
MKARNRVFIFDHQPIVRKGLEVLIKEMKTFDVCGASGNTAGFFEQIKGVKPDIIILDIALNEGSGIELIKDILFRHPGIKIFVFSQLDETIYADHVLRAGASGYMMKTEQTVKIEDALKSILRGEIFVSEEIRLPLLKRLLAGSKQSKSSIELLSSRELEVFQLLGRGLSTKKIADELHLGIKTIETYRYNIKKKLGIRDNTALIHQAAKWSMYENNNKKE